MGRGSPALWTAATAVFILSEYPFAGTGQRRRTEPPRSWQFSTDREYINPDKRRRHVFTLCLCDGNLSRTLQAYHFAKDPHAIPVFLHTLYHTPRGRKPTPVLFSWGVREVNTHHRGKYRIGPIFGAVLRAFAFAFLTISLCFCTAAAAALASASGSKCIPLRFHRSRCALRRC